MLDEIGLEPLPRKAILPAMDGSIGLHQWLTTWLKVYAQHKVVLSTYENYVTAVNLIKNWLADAPLDSYLEMDIQIAFNGLAEAGYSRSQIHTLRVVLNQAFVSAIRQQMIRFNPAQYTQIPKEAPTKIVNPLTRSQQDLLEQACREDIHGDLFLFMLYSGLRRSELCNLKWADFDRQNRELYIRKSKTAAGVRMIPLLTICVQIISLQPHICDYIFTSNKTGAPITGQVLRCTYERLRRKTGIVALTNHVCRHTFATRLVEENLDPKAISALLGHVSVEFTLNRYVKALPDYLRQQILKVDNFSLAPQHPL